MFVSADDQLIRVHAPWLSQHLRSGAGADGEVPQNLEREVAKIQRKVERAGYAKRRQLFAHDSWLEDVMAKLAKKADG